MEEALWLAMGDGARLDATVCLPEGAPPWPAVVVVHGHGEDGSKATTLERARRQAALGRIGLAYSVRGQGASEGLSFHLGARELFDLQEVVAWLGRREDVRADRIAVWGGSQGGWHAWMAAAFAPVRCAIPEHVFVDYADFAVPEGALSTWFFTRTMRRRVMSAGLQEQARRWAIDGDWDRLRANLSPYSPRWYADRIRCPILAIHGWHDNGMPPNELIAMIERLGVEKQLYLGGGGHDGQDAIEAESARMALVDAFLARHLDGVGDAPERPIRYAMRPRWEHREAVAFGPASTADLYLRSGGSLSAEPPSGPTPNSNIQHQGVDPAYTLAVALHRDLAGSAAAWPREEARFDGPVVDAPLDLVGAPRFVLHVLPERPFYQVHAELWDVAPDGVARLVSRAHAGSTAASPGTHLRLELVGRAIAWRLEAGHRLRVIVADQNVGYVVPVYRPWRARLYHELDRASLVRLPVG